MLERTVANNCIPQKKMEQPAVTTSQDSELLGGLIYLTYFVHYTVRYLWEENRRV